MRLTSEDKFDRHLDTVRIGRSICFGGSPTSPGPQTNTTNTSNLPAYLQPYVERNLGASEAQAGNAYQAYTGPRVAGFTGDQQNTMSQTMQMQQPGQFSAATAATQGVVGSSWANPGTAQNFMNPYQQGVTDIAKREAARQSDIQGVQSDANFAKAGAFGGSRQGVMDAERRRNLGQQMNDIQTQGANQAYQQGMGQYNAEQGRQLGAAGQLATIGDQSQNAQLARLGAQAGVGAQEQGLNQQQQDIAYQNFVDARDYGKNQANWMSGIIHGTPYSANSSTTATQSGPSMASQLAGLGIAGAGAYSAYKKG